MMSRRVSLPLAGVVMLLAAAAVSAGGPGAGASPFAFLSPPVSVEPGERARLDAGEAVAKVLRGGEDDLAIFGAVRLDAGGDRLRTWARRLEHLQGNKYVGTAVRFSDPPRLQDLDGLALDDKDLEDIRRCQPGDCGVKLDGEEIALLRHTVSTAGAAWKLAVQLTFRRIVLARVNGYRSGSGAGAVYHDHREPVSLGQEFSRLLAHSPFLLLHLPDVAHYLQAYPHAPALDGAESFLYWSKDVLAARPIFSVTHVTIVAPGGAGLPEALVLSRQVFATHYLSASLGLTAVTQAAPGGPRYLLYVNRSRVDMLKGPFGGLLRRIVERRVRAEAPGVLNQLRERLERDHPTDAEELRPPCEITRD